jgi:hypothetical protein
MNGAYDNSDPTNNYYEVADNVSSATINFGGKGGNVGSLNTADLDKGIATGSHEINHGFGGKDHPGNPAGSGKQAHIAKGEEIDISVPQNTVYTGTTDIVDISNRKVTQGIIDAIMKDINFDVNGEAAIGKTANEALNENKK